jgi:hypothetical protein
MAKDVPQVLDVCFSLSDVFPEIERRTSIDEVACAITRGGERQRYAIRHSTPHQLIGS